MPLIEEGIAFNPRLPEGQALPRSLGAGSGELLQRGNRMWVDAGTVEPQGSDRV